MKLIAYSLEGETHLRRGVLVDEENVLEVPGDFRALSSQDLDELEKFIKLQGSTGKRAKLSEVKLHAPIPNTLKILCIGLNYRDHCEESGLPVPESPVLFAKYHNSLIGHGEAILLDGFSKEVDYEAELAFVIGKRAYRVKEEEAMDYVAGYVTANDVSGRDLQFFDKQWIRGKSQDTFCPMGPWLVTKHEVGDPHKLSNR